MVKSHIVRIHLLKVLEGDDKIYDDFEDHPIVMVNDMVDHAENFETLIEDAEKLIYPGSKYKKLPYLRFKSTK